MAGEAWEEGTLYDEQGELAIASVCFSLTRSLETDGFVRLAGAYAVQAELEPLHTGLAQLIPRQGEGWLVRVLRITRPHGSGELEVVEPLGAMPEAAHDGPGSPRA